MAEVYLSELNTGDCLVVQTLSLCTDFRQRLQDLGMLPGSSVVCAYIAPSGSPMAFWVKGALIALRKDDCCRIRGVRCCE